MVTHVLAVFEALSVIAIATFAFAHLIRFLWETWKR